VSESDKWTVGRLLSWTTEFLSGEGATSARLDAEILLAASLGCQRIDLYTRFDEQPGQGARDQFRQLVRQRADGCPVAYLVGQREFYSRQFQVTPDVLIPRPETEFIVITALDLLGPESRDATIRIADVGTGSGNIAICLAQQLPGSSIVAIDISPAALDVARCNIEMHGVESQVELLESDLLAAVDQPLDMVVSNPPYVSEAEYEQLPPDVREFEPRLALVAGASGLEVYQRLLPEAAERLQPGGWLVLETSPMICESLVELINSTVGFGPVELTRDLAGKARVVRTQRHP
jgi:release factor glutamine methyltransferase